MAKLAFLVLAALLLVSLSVQAMRPNSESPGGPVSEPATQHDSDMNKAAKLTKKAACVAALTKCLTDALQLPNQASKDTATAACNQKFKCNL